MPKSRPRRSVPWRVGGVIGAASVLVLALSGCIGNASPTETPTASSSAEPIFASDGEALAAAQDAYLEYTEAINTITHEDNRSPERIRDVVTDEWAAHVEGLLKDFSQRGLTIEGATTVDSFRLVEVAQMDGIAEVSFLVCSDVTGTRVVDSEGVDVTPAGRPDRSALQVRAVSSSNSARTLLVDEEEPWSGEYC